MRKRFRWPFLESGIEADIPLAILLVPLWWILGITNVVFHALSVFLLVKLLVLKSKTRSSLAVPGYLFFLLLFITTLILALVFNLQGIPTMRLIAAVYNLSFWIMAATLFVVIHNTVRRSSLPSLMRAFVAFGMMNGVLSLGGTLLWLAGTREVVIPSLLGLVVNINRLPTNMPLIQYIFSLRITATGWVFLKDVPRSFGFSPYPTALALTMMLSVGMTLGYYHLTKKKSALAALLVELVPLALTFSRTAVLGLIIGGLVVYTLLNFRRLRFATRALLIAIALIAVGLSVPARKLAEPIDKFRAESTSFRINLYEKTLEEAVKKPVLGYGFKPLEEDATFPIASHSSFVGIIYRSGFLGFGLLVFFFAAVLVRWWRQKAAVMNDRILQTFWFWSGVCILGGLVWMLTEDLDAPALAAFLFFTIIGYACGLKRAAASAPQPPASPNRL